MNAVLLRLVWSVIEDTPPHILTGFDDSTLSKHLVNRVESQVHLSRDEHRTLWSYLTSRMPLIRDLAHQKVA